VTSSGPRNDNPPPALRAGALAGKGGVRHGFFTREGGVSRGGYASLNCGFGSDDDPAHVAENRRRVAASLGVTGESLVTVYQIHSADAVKVAAPWRHADSPRADGMATDRPGVALGVLAADCAPVLFADEAAGVIGACHAGWRGALGGVTDATIAAMESLGADRARIHAAIGPCIAQGSYEVGPEFRDAFLAEDAASEDFFAIPAPGAKPHFDLSGFVAARLRAAGLAAVEPLGRDTYADETLFSYRRCCHRGEGDFGRLISAIALAG
jgi:YfiH family protein